METCLAAAADDEYRGHDGPLILERGPASSPLFRAFFEAVQQAGYSLTDDVNGYRQEGFAPFDRNVHRGRRLSASRAYLRPVMGRPNLEVRTRAFVSRVVVEGSRVAGVEYDWHGGHHVTRGEVILCGGAINTPQLLQVSGVGDEADLKAAGVQVRHRLSGSVLHARCSHSSPLTSHKEPLRYRSEFFSSPRPTGRRAREIF